MRPATIFIFPAIIATLLSCHTGRPKMRKMLPITGQDTAYPARWIKNNFESLGMVSPDNANKPFFFRYVPDRYTVVEVWSDDRVSYKGNLFFMTHDDKNHPRYIVTVLPISDTASAKIVMAMQNMGIDKIPSEASVKGYNCNATLSPCEVCRNDEFYYSTGGILSHSVYDEHFYQSSLKEAIIVDSFCKYIYKTAEIPKKFDHFARFLPMGRFSVKGIIWTSNTYNQRYYPLRPGLVIDQE